MVGAASITLSEIPIGGALLLWSRGRKGKSKQEKFASDCNFTAPPSENYSQKQFVIGSSTSRILRQQT
jgi:hypothetical protein